MVYIVSTEVEQKEEVAGDVFLVLSAVRIGYVIPVTPQGNVLGSNKDGARQDRFLFPRFCGDDIVVLRGHKLGRSGLPICNYAASFTLSR